MTQTLYSLRKVFDGFSITKFDEDYNPATPSYGLSAKGDQCSCPAGPRPTCKHRKMFPLFQAQGHIDDGWFLVWETRQWLKPIGFDIAEAMAPAFESEASHRAMPLGDGAATVARSAPSPTISVKRRKV